MRKILACVCVIALLPTGVLGQAPGEPPPPPAPPPAGDGLDEARGQEIRQSLPASHRDPAAR
jgi:hypothetical protein